MTETTSRVSETRLRAVASGLSERDWQILSFLAAHRFASTIHIREAFFASHATPLAAARACIRVLDRHLRDRLLGRLERRVGGTKHGSSSFIWHLDVIGHRLTQPDHVRRRLTVPSPDFLDHALAVADTHVGLIAQTRRTGTQLERVAIEAEAWRSFITAHGTTTILKPDLYAHLSTADFDDHWYIEVDRGTEHLPVLLTKCAAYTAYKATGRAQAEHGVFPRVLWIVPTLRRVERLKSAIHADPKLPNRLFTVITPDQLATTIDPATNTSTPAPRKEEP